MKTFEARCVLYNIKTKEKLDELIRNAQDIFDIIGDGNRDRVSQVDIDMYHKIYYNKNELENGISGWVTLTEEYDTYTKSWASVSNARDYIAGDFVLLVLCDDKTPIDITDKAEEFIISCIKC